MLFFLPLIPRGINVILSSLCASSFDCLLIFDCFLLILIHRAIKFKSEDNPWN